MEALSTLKDELLNNLPANDSQLSQSLRSGSIDMFFPVSKEDRNCISVAMSDVDSAFVDNIESHYKSVEQNVPNLIKNNSSSHVEHYGTYSAFPGIVITENSSTEPLPSENGAACLPFDSSTYPISKVNSWLSSKTKSPINSENGCEFINMYPCENSERFHGEHNQNIQDSNVPVAIIGKKQDELITSSKITKPSKLPWLFGVHRNPKVVSTQ